MLSSVEPRRLNTANSDSRPKRNESGDPVFIKQNTYIKEKSFESFAAQPDISDYLTKLKARLNIGKQSFEFV